MLISIYDDLCEVLPSVCVLHVILLNDNVLDRSDNAIMWEIFTFFSSFHNISLSFSYPFCFHKMLVFSFQWKNVIWKLLCLYVRICVSTYECVYVWIPFWFSSDYVHFKNEKFPMQYLFSYYLHSLFHLKLNHIIFLCRNEGRIHFHINTLCLSSFTK